MKREYLDLNNRVLKAIKAGLKLRDDEIRQIWRLGGTELSKNAAKTFFTGQNNKNYRRCSDEELVKFMNGFVRYTRDCERI